MSLKQKSIRGFIWDLTGNISLQAFGFFITIILTRLLLPTDFGLIAIVTSIMYLGRVFFDLGFNVALIQKRNISNLHFSSVFFLNLITGFTLCVLFFFLAPVIANFYENNVLQNLIRLMSIGFIINSFGNVTRSYLRRKMNFKIISITNIIAAIISGIIALFMAYNGYGVWSLIWQLLINELLSNILIFILSKFKFSLYFDFLKIKELWNFSSKIFLSGFIDTVFNTIDSLLIGKVLNTATLGYYSRAQSLERFSTRYTSGSLSSVLLPSLSSIQNNESKFNHAIINVSQLFLFTSLLLCGIIFVSSKEIVLLLFGNKWSEAIPYLKIIIVAAFAEQFFQIFQSILLSKGYSANFLKINSLKKLLMFLNLGTLFFGNLRVYLIIFSLIRIFSMVLGILVISKRNALGKILIIEVSRNLIIYIISILITVFLISYQKNDNLLLGIIINTFVYITLFLLISYLTKSKSLLYILEIVKSFLVNK